MFRQHDDDETIFHPVLLNQGDGPLRLILRRVRSTHPNLTGETAMIRKTMLALATAAVAVAALAPSVASASPYKLPHHHHNHHHGFHGWRGVGLGFAIAAPVVAASCYQYQYVETRRGLRRILVNTCAY
jgi:hypothetical protein